MTIQILLGIAVLFFHLTSAWAAPTLAEKLGYPADTKILILHADDMGLNELTNQAIADVLDYGLVKSASIMIPAPAAEAAIRAYGKQDLGLHLTLNSEWEGFRWRPITQPESLVSSLVQKKSQGPFLHSDHIPLFIKGKTSHVRLELENQIQQALAWGLKPTHLDYHMASVLLKKRWVEEYLHLAKRYEIPPMLFKWTDHVKKQLPPFLGPYLKDVSQSAEKAGFILLDWVYLTIPHRDYEQRKQSYIDIFNSLQPGVSYVFMHPAYMPQRHPFPRGMAKERPLDAQLMQDPSLKEVLKNLNIVLIGWREIQAIYDWKQVHWPDPSL